MNAEKLKSRIYNKIEILMSQINDNLKVDCICNNCQGQFLWSDLYCYSWGNVNYPVNSSYITNYVAGYCPVCGAALIHKIDGQTQGYEATKYGTVKTSVPSIGMLWYNSDSPLKSAYLKNPDLLAFENRDLLDMKAIIEAGKDDGDSVSTVSDEKISEMVSLISKNDISGYQSKINLTADEYADFWSEKRERHFLYKMIKSFEMLDVILQKYEELEAPELVKTFLIILRNCDIPIENEHETGTRLGVTVKKIKGEHVAKEFLLPKAINTNYDWVSRIHLLGCLAEVGLLEIKPTIDAWINPNTNVKWVYKSLKIAQDKCEGENPESKTEIDVKKETLFTENKTNVSVDEQDDLVDIDGNHYKTVKIGNQIWMAENLKVTKYNDGTQIPYCKESITEEYEEEETYMVKEEYQSKILGLFPTNKTKIRDVTKTRTVKKIREIKWEDLKQGAYCFYENDELHKEQYGAMYNWQAVNTGLAPKGWHVPSDAEWDTLQNYLIANGYNYDGTTSDNKIAKALASTTGWETSTNKGAIGNNPSTNNRSGFNALPGGERSCTGYFGGFGGLGVWWCSQATHAYYRSLYSSRSELYRYGDYEQNGFSVRCVKD